MKADPKLGRAAALRNAMLLAFMDDRSSPLNAYPAFWRPFCIIGEGAARCDRLISDGVGAAVPGGDGRRSDRAEQGAAGEDRRSPRAEQDAGGSHRRTEGR